MLCFLFCIPDRTATGFSFIIGKEKRGVKAFCIPCEAPTGLSARYPLLWHESAGFFVRGCRMKKAGDGCVRREQAFVFDSAQIGSSRRDIRFFGMRVPDFLCGDAG